MSIVCCHSHSRCQQTNRNNLCPIRLIHCTENLEYTTLCEITKFEVEIEIKSE